MVEGEVIRSVEREKKPLFDAALIHGAWLSQKGESEPVKLSLRSRLAIRAAALLFNGGSVGNFVLTAGKIWGPDYPSIAALMAEELVRKYAIPPDRVTVWDNALNTNEEIETFLQLASEHGWRQLLDIAAKTHQWTIPSLYERKGEKPKFESVENILMTRGNKRAQRLVRRLGQSEHEWSYRLYEGAVRLVMMLNPDYAILTKWAEAYRSKKGHFIPPPLSKLLPPPDAYKL